MENKDRDEKGKFAKGNKLGNRFDANGAQTEIARKGAIASNEKQAERKRLRELAEIIANETISTTMPDGSKRSTTFSEALIIGQYREAMKGKTEAAKFLATIMGDFVEKKEETVKAEVSTEDPYADMPIESQERIAKVILEERHKHYKATHDAKKDTDDE